ncbi:MAG TPA: hypothetical protein VF026_29780 [Ktedonobacteraceae bacterium]
MSNGPLSAGLSFALFLNSSKTLPLGIVNKSDQPLSWHVDAGGANWVTLDRSNGTLIPEEQQTIYVTAQSDQTTGDFPSTLTFTPTVGGTNLTPVPLTVELHVSVQPYSDNGPKAPKVSQSRIDFVPHRVNNTLQNNPSSLQFSNPKENGSVRWTLTSMVSWLILDKDTDILEGEGQQVVNVTADQSALTTKGTYTTDLILTLAFNDQLKKDREPTSVLIPISLVIP